MTLPRVFVTRQIPDIGLELLHPHAQVEVWPNSQPPSSDILLEKIPHLHGLLCLLTDPINQTLINAGTSLKVISQMAVGYDNIDVKAATRKNIPVGNTPGVLTDATADLTWALLMGSARRIVEAEKFVHAGKWTTWEPMLLLGADVAGATLGIVGLGRIGEAVARRARGFNMRIIYSSRQRKSPQLEQSLGVEYVDFETLLRESDFVTIHTALSAETHHLFSDRAFSLMKKTAILINTARGSIVNQDALYQALKKGEIAAAALDVTDPEPIPLDNPLLSLPNCLILPHIGSASYKTRALMAKMAAENLIAGLLEQKLPHCVNPEVYQHKLT